ncbi:hypothetical protein J830_4070 [Acinetobacter baumannii 25691_7]|nr:hypothetical protein J830_4070 [Acinetobacter baumannii 25691_7]
MLKRSIAFALLAAAGHAYSADIEVTSLVDEDKDDTVCTIKDLLIYENFTYKNLKVFFKVKRINSS